MRPPAQMRGGGHCPILIHSCRFALEPDPQAPSDFEHVRPRRRSCPKAIPAGPLCEPSPTSPVR